MLKLRLAVLFALLGSIAYGAAGDLTWPNKNVDGDQNFCVTDGAPPCATVLTLEGSTQEIYLPFTNPGNDGRSNIKFTSANNAVISANAGLTIAIDANANETDRLMAVKTNAADNTGTLRMSVDENGHIVAGNVSGADFLGAPVGYGGSGVKSSSLSSTENTGIPIYAGTRGEAHLLVCSRNNATGNGTAAATYIMRSFFDGTGWTTGAGITFLGGGANAANTGGDVFSFGCTPNCTTSTATLTVTASGNWQCQVFGNG